MSKYHWIAHVKNRVAICGYDKQGAWPKRGRYSTLPAFVTCLHCKAKLISAAAKLLEVEAEDRHNA